MYKRIVAEEAKQVIDTESDIVILDVRTEGEYMQGHIANSVLIPLDVLSMKVESIIPNKDTKILVYCRSGSRSRVASEILIKMKYKNVYDFGGVMNWRYGVEK